MHSVAPLDQQKWIVLILSGLLWCVAGTAWAQTPPPAVIAPAQAPVAAEAPEGVRAAEDTADAHRVTVTDPAQTPNPYALKLRDIEERVNALKERIFAAKSKLMQLQEAILQGTSSGARVLIIHRNEMSNTFKIKRLQYTLDGTPIYNVQASNDSSLVQRNEIEIFSASIAPGKHQLNVYVEYTGNGFGVFDYWNGYTFKLKSTYAFSVEEGKLTTVRAVGYESGGITTELDDRPAMRYDVEMVKAMRQVPDAADQP